MARSITVREEFDPATGDIRHLLDMGLRIERETAPPRTSNRWSASHLGYCLRRQFFERAGVPSTVTGDDPSRIFWIGNQLEWGVTNRLRHAGLLVADQIHVVSEEHSISGYIDLIYGGVPTDDDPAAVADYSPAWRDYLRTYKERVREEYPDGVPITAVELKSASEYSVEKQYQEGPQFHNTMQGATYKLAERLGLLPENIPAIERFQLAVIAKSSAKILVFDILESHVEKALARLDELNDAWPLELPPCSCGQTMGWEPRYCPYRNEGNPRGDSCCDQMLIHKGPKGPGASEEFWKLADAALAEREGREATGG